MSAGQASALRAGSEIVCMRGDGRVRSRSPVTSREIDGEGSAFIAGLQILLK